MLTLCILGRPIQSLNIKKLFSPKTINTSTLNKLSEQNLKKIITC